ncbi:aromatic prenyltransferase, partial [Mycena alexandri]
MSHPEIFQLRKSFWKDKTENLLIALLRISEYPESQIAAYRDFYASYVTPQLGPRPEEFGARRPSSYMADDFTPIEFSWAVDANGTQTIRFTMEPLSPTDGAPSPVSTWISSLESLCPYTARSGFDLRWSKICHETLVQDANQEIWADDVSKHGSQFSIGCDFTRSGLVTGKSYFLPHIRSKSTGVSCSAIVTGCMLRLGLETPWTAVYNFLRTLPSGLEVTPEIVSVDCVEPCKNRAKVYLRTNAATLQSILEVMTLGFSLTDPMVAESVHVVRQLWQLLFPTAGQEMTIISHNEQHYASGFVIYFEMVLGVSLPLPKVYIPVRHYCDNDLSIAEAVSSYFVNSPKQYSSVEAIRNLFTHRSLATRTGIYTYVGCAARRTGPQVSLYISPEVFAPEHET